MKKVKQPMRYKIHRTVGIIIVPLLLLSAMTGFFRANSKWFWDPGYKQKKQETTFALTPDMLTMQQLGNSLGTEAAAITQVVLTQEAGKPYYLVQTAATKKYLVDAQSGKIVSPLNEELAQSFAAQYVVGNPKVVKSELLEDYKTRKEKALKPVYKVAFSNDVHSEIYLDRTTGEIVEDVDDHRRFALMMVKLHDYDFLNSKREITSLVGLGVVFLGLSGLWIFKFRRRRKKHSV